MKLSHQEGGQMELVDDRTFGEKISDDVSKFGGSWWFIFTAMGSIALWIIINTLALFQVIAWDNYPFILLNLFLSMVAAFQAPFILMSQKRFEKKQDEAYRILFSEIKELVETDLEIEKEIMDNHKSMAEDVAELKKEIKELKDLLKRD